MMNPQMYLGLHSQPFTNQPNTISSIEKIQLPFQ